VIDRLHLKGHVGKLCQTRNNPDKYPLLKNVNTMVCEQINFWASGYKHASKHMNQTRFNFFFLIIFNEFNVIRCKGRNQIFEPFKSNIYSKKTTLQQLTNDFICQIFIIILGNTIHINRYINILIFSFFYLNKSLF